MMEKRTILVDVLNSNTKRDLNSTVDESIFKEKWLKMIEKMFSSISELNSIQLDQLNRQDPYNSLNHTDDTSDNQRKK